MTLRLGSRLGLTLGFAFGASQLWMAQAVWSEPAPSSSQLQSSSPQQSGSTHSVKVATSEKAGNDATSVLAEATGNLAEARAWLQEMAAPLQKAPRLEVVFDASIETADGASQPGYQGRLWTADSNRFRLEIPAGTYVSDGQTYWEYHPSTHQVIVKPVSAIAGQSLPVRMLLGYLAAPPLACDTLGKGKKALVRIALKPDPTAGQIDSLQILISLKQRKWQSVSTLDVNGTRTTYVLSKCGPAKEWPKPGFAFTPPSGVEVVDMR